MAKPFGERLATALRTNHTNCETLRELIAETEAEQGRQEALQAKTEAESVDVLLNASERDEAAATADRAKRLASGYADALEKLRAKLAAKEDGERRKREADEKVAALAQRDELAARFAREVPALLEQLTGLFDAVGKNDAWMKAIGVHERGAEAEARDVPGNFIRNGTTVDQFTKMKIPSWSGSGRMWPPAQKSAFAGYDEGRRQAWDAYERRNSPEARAEAAAAQAREDAHYRDCRIFHNRCALIGPIAHRRGVTYVDTNDKFEVQMTSEQMEAARALGVRVEPVAVEAVE